MVTRSVEDYLKAIYKLQHSGSPATTNLIAERLALRAASVTAMLQQLSRQGLAEYKPYRGAYLTDEGLSAALRVIRRHRLIELYLHQQLGVPWDRVDAEAERLEHAISPYLEEQIDARLGHPSFDPHGAPIPSSTGALPEQDLVPLAALPLNTPATVRHIPDDNPDLLRHAASLGLVPDAVVTVLECKLPDGPLIVQVGQPQEQHPKASELEKEAALTIFVNRPPAEDAGH